jgi:hypothetical protein
MSHNVEDEDSLRPVIHSSDQSMLVASHVEDCPSSDQVGIAIHLFQFHRRFPVCFAHHCVPRFEAGLRIGMHLPELLQSASFDDAHRELGSHNEDMKSSFDILWLRGQ